MNFLSYLYHLKILSRKQLKTIIILLAAIILIPGCSSKFELNENVTGTKVTLVDQDSTMAAYPDVIKDKVALIGFIYTHCPDICPMTTHNMMLAEEQLSKDDLRDVRFILISFDPERDTPSVLSKYAEVRNMDMNDWELLTGSRDNIDSLMKLYNVKAFPDDTTYNDNGEASYFMIHTDRISLVDQDGNLRKNYRGSSADPAEMANDIKSLL